MKIRALNKKTIHTCMATLASANDLSTSFCTLISCYTTLCVATQVKECVWGALLTLPHIPSQQAVTSVHNA